MLGLPIRKQQRSCKLFVLLTCFLFIYHFPVLVFSNILFLASSLRNHWLPWNKSMVSLECFCLLTVVILDHFTILCLKKPNNLYVLKLRHNIWKKLISLCRAEWHSRLREPGSESSFLAHLFGFTKWLLRQNRSRLTITSTSVPGCRWML